MSDLHKARDQAELKCPEDHVANGNASCNDHVTKKHVAPQFSCRESKIKRMLTASLVMHAD